jgi:hypothetical protein
VNPLTSQHFKYRVRWDHRTVPCWSHSDTSLIELKWDGVEVATRGDTIAELVWGLNFLVLLTPWFASRVRQLKVPHWVEPFSHYWLQNQKESSIHGEAVNFSEIDPFEDFPLVDAVQNALSLRLVARRPRIRLAHYLRLLQYL